MLKKKAIISDMGLPRFFLQNIQRKIDKDKLIDFDVNVLNKGVNHLMVHEFDLIFSFEKLYQKHMLPIIRDVYNLYDSDPSDLNYEMDNFHFLLMEAFVYTKFDKKFSKKDEYDKEFLEDFELNFRQRLKFLEIELKAKLKKTNLMKSDEWLKDYQDKSNSFTYTEDQSHVLLEAFLVNATKKEMTQRANQIFRDEFPKEIVEKYQYKIYLNKLLFSDRLNDPNFAYAILKELKPMDLMQAQKEYKDFILKFEKIENPVILLNLLLECHDIQHSELRYQEFFKELDIEKYFIKYAELRLSKKVDYSKSMFENEIKLLSKSVSDKTLTYIDDILRKVDYPSILSQEINKLNFIINLKL